MIGIIPPFLLLPSRGAFLGSKTCLFDRDTRPTAEVIGEGFALHILIFHRTGTDLVVHPVGSNQRRESCVLPPRISPAYRAESNATHPLPEPDERRKSREQPLTVMNRLPWIMHSPQTKGRRLELPRASPQAWWCDWC